MGMQIFNQLLSIILYNNISTSTIYSKVSIWSIVYTDNKYNLPVVFRDITQTFFVQWCCRMVQHSFHLRLVLLTFF